MLPASTRFGGVCTRCQLLAELSASSRALSAFNPSPATVQRRRHTATASSAAREETHITTEQSEDGSIGRRERPTSRPPLRRRHYDLKVVPESLSETLAAHRGMNRVHKVHSPLVDNMDEDRRWGRRARGIDKFESRESLEGTKDGSWLNFNPSYSISHHPKTPLKQTPLKDQDHNRLLDYGDTSSTPWHTRIHDPTFPSISWRERDSAGQLLKQYPWRESANATSTNIAIDAQTRLQNELASFAAYMSPNHQEHEARRRVAHHVYSILQYQNSDSLQTVVLSEDASTPVVPHSSLMFRISIPVPAPLKTTLFDDGSSQQLNLNRHTLVRRRLSTLQAIHEKLSNARTSDGNLEFAHVRLTTHGTPDPYIAARHVQSGLRVVLSTGIICSRERSDTVARYIGEYPVLKPLHTVFRTFLEMRGLFDGEGAFASGSEENIEKSRRNLNWYWKKKSTSSSVLSQQLPSHFRCLDSYTLLILLVASLKLGKRSWFAKGDLAGPLLHVLEFLASWDTSKTAISVDPAEFFPRHPQSRFYKHKGDSSEEASQAIVDSDMRSLQRNMVRMNKDAFCIQDPVEPTLDLGNGVSMGLQTQSALTGALRDMKARMAAWDDGNEEAVILEVLGTSYKSMEEWRDQLLLGAGRLDTRGRSYTAGGVSRRSARRHSGARARGSRRSHQQRPFLP